MRLNHVGKGGIGMKKKPRLAERQVVALERIAAALERAHPESAPPAWISGLAGAVMPSLMYGALRGAKVRRRGPGDYDVKLPKRKRRG